MIKFNHSLRSCLLELSSFKEHWTWLREFQQMPSPILHGLHCHAFSFPSALTIPEGRIWLPITSLIGLFTSYGKTFKTNGFLELLQHLLWQLQSNKASYFYLYWAFCKLLACCWSLLELRENCCSIECTCMLLVLFLYQDYLGFTVCFGCLLVWQLFIMPQLLKQTNCTRRLRLSSREHAVHAVGPKFNPWYLEIKTLNWQLTWKFST